MGDEIFSGGFMGRINILFCFRFTLPQLLSRDGGERAIHSMKPFVSTSKVRNTFRQLVRGKLNLREKTKLQVSTNILMGNETSNDGKVFLLSPSLKTFRLTPAPNF